MVIVPVTPLGAGLTGVDAPGAKPLAPTGALGSAPSEEVSPSGGMTVPTWANAGLQHNKAVANINNFLIGYPLFERKAYAASGRKDRRRLGSGSDGFVFSLPLTDDKLSQQPRRGRRAGDPGVAGAGEASDPGSCAARARRIA
jgi:hypothetical protein